MFAAFLADSCHKPSRYLLYDCATDVSIRLYPHIVGRVIRPTHGTGKIRELGQEKYAIRAQHPTGTHVGARRDTQKTRRRTTTGYTDDRNEKGEISVNFSSSVRT